MMPQDHSSRKYTKYHAQVYVRFLGLWCYPNPSDHIGLRDPQDYRQRLMELIEANKSRDDDAGRWETEYAMIELLAIEQP